MGSFWWKDVLRLNVLFRGIATCDLENGASVCFWDDLWLDGVLSHKYPRLASYAKSDGISILQVMQAEDLDTLFMLPLSEQALDELEALQEQLQEVQYDQEETDSWTPIWGNTYASRRYYSHVFSGIAQFSRWYGNHGVLCVSSSLLG